MAEENGAPHTDIAKRREVLPPEEIRTLYVLGLPKDVRYREVYNFFRFIPGFEHLSLNISGRSPAAWVIFDAHDEAIAALERINNLNFDPEDEELNIRVELAKNNSHARKRTRQEINADRDYHMKRSRNDRSPYAAAAPAYASVHPHAAASAHQAHAAATAAYATHGIAARPDLYGQTAAYAAYPAAAAAAAAYARDPYAAHRPAGRANPQVIATVQQFLQYNGHQPVQVPVDPNPPCSTLFVGSIARETSEQELREAFQGCNRFKFTAPREKGGPIVFVDYGDIDTAVAVRDLLYGFRFRSAMHYDQGIKIEFAKNKMSSRPEY